MGLNMVSLCILIFIMFFSCFILQWGDTVIMFIRLLRGGQIKITAGGNPQLI
jgi:hypothetical protein